MIMAVNGRGYRECMGIYYVHLDICSRPRDVSI